MNSVKVKDLQVGMLCDLEGDKYADTDGNHPHQSTIENEFVSVDHIERETNSCIRIHFSDFDAVGFPPDHEIKVKTGFIT